MIDSRKFTVLLGTATNDPSTVASGKAVAASTKEDVKAARQDIAAGSLDHLDIVLNANDLAALYDPMELSGWTKCLQEGATVSVSVLGNESTAVDSIHSSFLLAGLKGVSERRQADGTRVFTAHKPSAIKSSSGAKPLSLAKKSAVSISLNDGDDDDLIDEDNLLAGDSALAPPPAMEATATAGDDCGGRTACDDCTCGRADAEGAAKKQSAAKSSSCGKCGLGDAFRCASCPYLGMPAFKPGEESVLLNLQDDIDI